MKPRFPLLVLCCSLLLLYRPTAAQNLPLIGSEILGQAANDFSGAAVDLDGDRLVIGSASHSSVVQSGGQVRVFEWNGSAWVALGAPIYGAASFDQLGHAVSLEGDRLAVGAVTADLNGMNSGGVYLYEWDGTAWQLLGSPIPGERAGDQSGFSVSLSGDRVAIGAPTNNDNGLRAGHVRVYEWNGSFWSSPGGDLDGQAAEDWCGFSVALDGDRLAVGSPYNDAAGSSAGQVRVYEWDGSLWTPVSTLNGVRANEQSGIAVDLDGDRLMIGANYNSDLGALSGQARIYEWNGATWGQMGSPLDGRQAYDRFAGKVALKGNYAVAGASSRSQYGPRVYRWDGLQWNPLGNDIDCAAVSCGGGVALSETRVATGSRLYSTPTDTLTGRVRVFGLCPSPVSTQVNTNGNTLSAAATGVRYQWLDCDSSHAPIANATSQSYTATRDGHYAVVLLDDACTDTTACIPFTLTNTTLLGNPSVVQVFPNPTTATTTVRLSDAFANATLRLRSMDGRLLYTEVVRQLETTLSLAGLPQGVYVLEVEQAGRLYHKALHKH